ncbi:MAG TPA: D-alanine--D-alanine ligase family protein [Vicinamibacterales bacterium]
MASKLRIGVVFGGRSGEHEVSIASAASICQHLDPTRYDVVPIHIAKDGTWSLPGAAPTLLSAADVHQQVEARAVQVVEPTTALAGSRVDVVFPILHGPYGEDGTVQGLLELANVPYVGAGVLGSAVGMDKAVMKSLFAQRGLPIVRHVTVYRREWERDPAGVSAHAAALGFPLFVKPANLGSSVGISKVKAAEALAPAMDLAFQFDRKAVVEAGVAQAREIECAVLGNDEPQASLPGEVIVTHADGFYSYDAKYLSPDGASWRIPAELPADTQRQVQRLSVEAFACLELSGMARVDFFLDRATGALYLNEVNTLPGFTAISMYPKMWEASGLPMPALLDRLIALARERHAEKQRLRTSVV